MGDIHYEEHILKLIKVRSEIRQALECYKARKYAKEVYHMCRAKAMADALEISNDEFLDHKRIVELEDGMVDCLIDGDDTYYIDWLDNGLTIYTVIYASIYDNDFSSTNFTSYKEAEEYFAKKAKHYFDFDRRKEDSYGNGFDECVARGQAFFEDNGNHGDIYIWFTTENKFKL